MAVFVVAGAGIGVGVLELVCVAGMPGFVSAWLLAGKTAPHPARMKLAAKAGAKAIRVRVMVLITR